MELRWWLEGLRMGPVRVESNLAIRTIVGCYGKTLLAWMAYGAVAPGLFDAIVANRVDQLHLPEAAPPSAKASATPPGG